MKVRRALFYPDEKAGPSTFGETTSAEESVSSKVAEEAVPVEEVEPAVEAALPIVEAAPAIEEVDPVEAIPVVEEAAPVVVMEAPTLKKPPQKRKRCVDCNQEIGAPKFRRHVVERCKRVRGKLILPPHLKSRKVSVLPS